MSKLLTASSSQCNLLAIFFLRRVPCASCFPVLLRHVLPLLAGPFQVAGQLDADQFRLAVLADQGVDHLAQFGQAAADDRISQLRHGSSTGGSNSHIVPPLSCWETVASSSFSREAGETRPLSISGSNFCIASRENDA